MNGAHRLFLVWVLLLLVTAACADRDDRKANESAHRESSTSAEPPRGPESLGVGGEPGPITIVLTVDGESLRSSGAGTCEHTRDASIHGVPAALWMAGVANAEGSIGSLNLTVWRPHAGDAPDQFSLQVDRGEESHRIDTVAGGSPVGSGTITVQSTGAGGRFEIEGSDAAGADVRLAVECPRFDSPEPVAG